MNIRELHFQLCQKGIIITEQMNDFLFHDIDPLMTCFETPGDIEEIAQMSSEKLTAYIALFEAMNFLENQSGTWIGEPEDWKERNAYWINTYPKAYRLLEIGVWG